MKSWQKFWYFKEKDTEKSWNLAQIISSMHDMWRWKSFSSPLHLHYFFVRTMVVTEGRPSLFSKDVLIYGWSVLLTLSAILLTGSYALRQKSWKILYLSWKSHEISFSDLCGNIVFLPLYLSLHILLFNFLYLKNWCWQHSFDWFLSMNRLHTSLKILKKSGNLKCVIYVLKKSGNRIWLWNMIIFEIMPAWPHSAAIVHSGLSFTSFRHFLRVTRSLKIGGKVFKS